MFLSASVCFIVFLYVHCCWRSDYQEDDDWYSIYRFISPMFCFVVVSNQDLDFHRHMSLFFLHSMNWSAKWMFALLILLEFFYHLCLDSVH